MPETFTVSGKLELGDGQIVTNGKPVLLLDDTGGILGEGKTDAAGAFTLQIESNQLSLQKNKTSTAPRFARIQSLFLAGASNLAGQQDAIGVRKPVIIDPRNMRPGANGFNLDTGDHKTKKVGAIYGKITLETSKNPTGIEIYIPGTTHIAKTNKDGSFLLGFLPKGTYSLRADKDGFNSVEWPKIVIDKEKTAHLEFA